MRFFSREEAGRELGARLGELGMTPDVVLGLPRGGVVVAAEVAHILEHPLEVIVVRKIGHPRYAEFAVGAVAEGGILVLDTAAQKENQVDRAELQGVIAAVTQTLRGYEAKFHVTGAVKLTDKVVLVVDDGLATGATMEAAVLSARKLGAKKVLVAVPVASAQAVARLRVVAAEVFALVVDEDFGAVGQYYDNFPQTTDEEVVGLLHQAQD